MSAHKKYSRRDFLKIFSGGAANTLTQAAASVVPDSAPSPAQRQRLVAKNLANARAESDRESNAQCARCYAAFAADQNEILCAACRAQEEHGQALLSNLFPPHTTQGPY